MMFEKLQPNDIFSLVVFHTSARTVIPSSFVKDLSFYNVKEMVNTKFESGGTTISTGFAESLKSIDHFKI